MWDFKLCIVVYMQPILCKVFILKMKWLFFQQSCHMALFSNIQYICWNNVCVCWNKTEVLNCIFINVNLNIFIIHNAALINGCGFKCPKYSRRQSYKLDMPLSEYKFYLLCASQFVIKGVTGKFRPSATCSSFVFIGF